MALVDVWLSEYYYEVMSRLRLLMDERGTTLAEIAAGTGLDSKTVWHATHGKKLQRSTKKLIAGFFGMDEEELFPTSDIPKAIFQGQPQATA